MYMPRKRRTLFTGVSVVGRRWLGIVTATGELCLAAKGASRSGLLDWARKSIDHIVIAPFALLVGFGLMMPTQMF
jgi:hypothetical protein